MCSAVFKLIDEGSVREIDRNYAIETLAMDVREIKDTTFQFLIQQAETAQVMWKNSNHIKKSLEHISANVPEIINSINAIGNDLQALLEVSGSISSSLDRISRQIEIQQTVMRKISDTLAKPYEAQALELRRQAEKWLRQGMTTRGTDRDEYWNDAMRLLNEVLKNPIGAQDYVTWFQLGWLEWKYEKNIEKAKQSFDKARRYAAPQLDLMYVKSLRHLAHMHYLTDELGSALNSIERAVEVVTIPNDVKYYQPVRCQTLYDAARYIWLTGNKRKSIHFLSVCIDIERWTPFIGHDLPNFKL